MIALMIQLVACVLLTCMATWWWVYRSSGEKARRMLLPFIIAAGATGILATGVVYWWDFFSLFFGGSSNVPLTWNVGGSQVDVRWVLPILLLTPFLPLLGFWRSVGQRPGLVSLSALVPAILTAIYLVD